jgi:hypothetical protein
MPPGGVLYDVVIGPYTFRSERNEYVTVVGRPNSRVGLFFADSVDNL